jgi:hypothetical protein
MSVPDGIDRDRPSVRRADGAPLELAAATPRDRLSLVTESPHSCFYTSAPHAARGFTRRLPTRTCSLAIGLLAPPHHMGHTFVSLRDGADDVGRQTDPSPVLHRTFSSHRRQLARSSGGPMWVTTGCTVSGPSSPVPMIHVSTVTQSSAPASMSRVWASAARRASS